MQEKRSRERLRGFIFDAIQRPPRRKNLLQGGRADNRVAPALVPLRQPGAPPAATVFSIVCAQAEHS
jgi:hypothetical protein